MKIYFAGSISGGRGDRNLYNNLIEYIKNYGTVLTEFIGSDKLLETGEQNISDKEIHDRDLAWLLEADVLIAEVTTPSLGVGYEIGRAVEHGKTVLCLYRESKNKRLSAMIAGCSAVYNTKYNDLQDAKSIIRNFLQEKQI